MLFCDCTRAAASRTFCTAGSNSASRMASTAITTRSWNRVNAGRERFFMATSVDGPAKRRVRPRRRGRTAMYARAARTSRLLERLDVRELAAQHRGAVAAEPVVEQGGVDAAEVGVVLQVAGVEVLQAGVGADDAALDRRPGHEQAGAG